MPKDYDNTNSGVLFKSEDKQDEKDRDYSGSINVGGVDYWLSGWIKTSKKGAKFLSLAVKPKEQATQRGPTPDKRGSTVADDIPFSPVGKWL